jgi:hypothetical protein
MPVSSVLGYSVAEALIESGKRDAILAKLGKETIKRFLAYDYVGDVAL